MKGKKGRECIRSLYYDSLLINNIVTIRNTILKNMAYHEKNINTHMNKPNFDMNATDKEKTIVETSYLYQNHLSKKLMNGFIDLINNKDFLKDLKDENPELYERFNELCNLS